MKRLARALAPQHLQEVGVGEPPCRLAVQASMATLVTGNEACAFETPQRDHRGEQPNEGLLRVLDAPIASHAVDHARKLAHPLREEVAIDDALVGNVG